MRSRYSSGIVGPAIDIPVVETRSAVSNAKYCFGCLAGLKVCCDDANRRMGGSHLRAKKGMYRKDVGKDQLDDRC